MALQHGLDVLHIRLGLVVLGLQVVDLVAFFLEETQDAFLLLLVGVKALQLANEVGDHIAHFAQVLGGHLGESGLREIADLLLAGRAVLQHLLAVGNVDLLRKGVHHGLFLSGQLDLLRGRGGLGLLFLGRSGFFHRVQRQGGGSGCVQIKIESVVLSHGDSFLSKSTR